MIRGIVLESCWSLMASFPHPPVEEVRLQNDAYVQLWSAACKQALSWPRTSIATRHISRSIIENSWVLLVMICAFDRCDVQIWRIFVLPLPCNGEKLMHSIEATLWMGRRLRVVLDVM